MDQIETMHMCETLHGTVNTSSRNSSHNSVDNVDSGYLSLTPNSGAHSSIISGYRSKVSSISKKHYRTRVDPLQSERSQRHRSKLNQILLNTFESDYSVSESFDTKSLIQKPSNTIDNRQSISLGHCSLNSTSQSFEFNLVIVPQSTPKTGITNSPRLETPALLPRIVVSSPCCKPINSSDSHKLSKLCITDIAKIKPKRLDFGCRTHVRPTPDYTGRETVDILALLGDKSNHTSAVSKILSYLSPLDLCSVSMVSKTWRRICTYDTKANKRRSLHVEMRQNVKENLKLIKKSKIEEVVPSSPKTRYAKRGYLLQVQNLQVKGNVRMPSSPPVSPSKVRFHSFVKASRTLAPTEYLQRCPKCSFACHVDRKKNVGTCSRQGCAIEFCILCWAKPHSDPCKKPLLATPTKRNKQRLIIGSRQSKRNLRRL